MVKYSIPCVSPASKTGQIFGWRRFATARASLRNRTFHGPAASPRNKGILRATCRWRCSSYARKTAPMLPRPSSRSMAYRPNGLGITTERESRSSLASKLSTLRLPAVHSPVSQSPCGQLRRKLEGRASFIDSASEHGQVESLLYRAIDLAISLRRGTPEGRGRPLGRGRQFGNARDQARCADLLGRASECVRRSAPAQRLDVGEERRVGTQRRQFLKQQRALKVVAEDMRGELLDRTVALDQSCGRLGSDFRNSRITVRCVADEREVVGDVRRRDTELRTHARVVANLPAPAIDLHHARA